jgi:Zn ribbon nucleic-acid-binding protein
MAIEILCPNCETDDHLTGHRDGDVIVITCSFCGLSWNRPAQPHCLRCGSTDVVAFPVPLVEKSRGTQMSITAMHVEFLCPTCDAERLRAPRRGHLPPSLGAT